MKKRTVFALTATATATAIGLALAMAGAGTPSPVPGPETTRQPLLTVTVVQLQHQTWPTRVAAHGNIVPWQETSIGTEANGLRLIDIQVNVGDVVRRGQPLAVFAAETLEAERAQGRAAVAEAEVALAEAATDAERAQALQDTGALSTQQIEKYTAAAHAARARLDAAKAAERAQAVRLAQALVIAPDDGIISARTATVGAVIPAGQELFRLIRRGRLEWHAEVAAADLLRLQPGQKVRLWPTGGDAIEGRVRVLAPVIDLQTRNGLVYVDLPASDALRAGAFARGEFEIGANAAMTLPLSAVQWREGFSHVMRVGPDSRAILTKVVPGRRQDDRVEIVSGLEAQDRVVATGVAFLGDGDLVRVSDAPPAATPAPPEAVPQRLTLAGREGQR